MKLILAIVASDVVDTLSKALIAQRYPVTQISSLGGFLRRGSITLVIGVEAEQVPDVLSTIHGAVSSTPRPDGSHAVTLFVLDASQFVQV